MLVVAYAELDVGEVLFPGTTCRRRYRRYRSLAVLGPLVWRGVSRTLDQYVHLDTLSAATMAAALDGGAFDADRIADRLVVLCVEYGIVQPPERIRQALAPFSVSGTLHRENVLGIGPGNHPRSGPLPLGEQPRNSSGRRVRAAARG
ncbi:hypothetical protein [Amycolatopsis sp.]|uniref:hypothetical protein n=1 Tax=Amycolatopsis sp. TaxID=37632 RepID=UPI002D7EDB23|nr:hypothetical protein [Amycolatopsis sp.]HET6703959.1 hypothetical protein [Amycolatopsis sp.]